MVTNWNIPQNHGARRDAIHFSDNDINTILNEFTSKIAIRFISDHLILHILGVWA